MLAKTYLPSKLLSSGDLRVAIPGVVSLPDVDFSSALDGLPEDHQPSVVVTALAACFGRTFCIFSFCQWFCKLSKEMSVRTDRIVFEIWGYNVVYKLPVCFFSSYSGL